MLYSNNVKTRISNAITQIAEKAAVRSVNLTCVWIQYEPKQPKALKEAASK